MQVVTAVKEDFFPLPGDSKRSKKKGNGAPGDKRETLSRYRSPKLLVRVISCKTTQCFLLLWFLSLMILDLRKTSIFDITLKTNCRNCQLIVFIYFKFNLNFGKGRLEVEVWKFVHGHFLLKTLLLVSTCLLSQAIVNQNFDSGNCVVVF